MTPPGQGEQHTHAHDAAAAEVEHPHPPVLGGQKTRPAQGDGQDQVLSPAYLGFSKVEGTRNTSPNISLSAQAAD